jgi:phosphoribosyl 1,2-cyclic phosphodiesterase
MDIQFWGVRGSIPSPGPDTAQFGGNTACVEVRCEGEPLIILDAGTGIRKLGMEIMKDPSVQDIFLFLSHTHWDHIQGMPFFIPLFSPKYSIKMYGPAHYSKNLQEILSLQMEYTYFPVRVEELAADISFNDITECQMNIGAGITIKTKFVNHPVVCLSYRIECGGKSFTYLTDHEPYRNLFLEAAEANREEGAQVAQEQNAALIDFIAGSDLLCVDAQYTPEEYRSRVGWGHSSVDDSYMLAREAHVKEMVIFHHDPDRSDADLQKILMGLQDRSWSPLSEAIPVRLAREGQIITL